MTKKTKTSKKKEQEMIDVFKDPINNNEEGEKEMENNIIIEKVIKEEDLEVFRNEISEMLNSTFTPFIDENKITQKKIDNLVDKLVDTVKDELLVNPIKTLLFCIKSITNLQKDLPNKNDVLTIEEVNKTIENNYDKLLKDMKILIGSEIGKINKDKNEEPKKEDESKEEPKKKDEPKEEPKKKDEPKEEPKKEEKEKPLSGFAYFLAQQKK